MGAINRYKKKAYVRKSVEIRKENFEAIDKKIKEIGTNYNKFLNEKLLELLEEE